MYILCFTLHILEILVCCGYLSAYVSKLHLVWRVLAKAQIHRGHRVHSEFGVAPYPRPFPPGDADALAISLPSGLHAARLIRSRTSRRSRVAVLAADQTRTVLSALALAISVPSGLQATLVTGAVCSL